MSNIKYIKFDVLFLRLKSFYIDSKTEYSRIASGDKRPLHHVYYNFPKFNKGVKIVDE